MAETDPAQNQPPGYEPPRVWTWEAPLGARTSHNRRLPSTSPSEGRALLPGQPRRAKQGGQQATMRPCQACSWLGCPCRT